MEHHLTLAGTLESSLKEAGARQRHVAGMRTAYFQGHTTFAARNAVDRQTEERTKTKRHCAKATMIKHSKRCRK